VLFILAPAWVTVRWYLVDEFSWKMIAALMAYLVWIALAVSWFRQPISRHVSALLAGIPLLDWIFLLPLLTASFFSFGITSALIPPVAFISALLLQRLAPAT